MSAEAQSHLQQSFDEASPAVLALPGTVLPDNDEAHGKLLFGLANEHAINGVRNALELTRITEATIFMKFIYFAEGISIKEHLLKRPRTRPATRR
jgi:hypothetical protein